MSDGVNVRELLESIRKAGGYRQGVDPRIGTFETIRRTSQWLNAVYPAQLDTLKRNAMLILNSKVVVYLDVDKRTIKYEGLDLTEVGADKIEKLQEVTNTVLGEGWVMAAVPGGNATMSHRATSRNSRKGSKSSRAGRTRRPSKGKR